MRCPFWLVQEVVKDGTEMMVVSQMELLGAIGSFEANVIRVDVDTS